MENVAGYWVGLLVLTGLASLCLVLRLPGRRWPAMLAVTVGAALVALAIGESGASLAILVAGCILTLASAATQRK